MLMLARANQKYFLGSRLQLPTSSQQPQRPVDQEPLLRLAMGMSIGGCLAAGVVRLGL